MVTTSRILLLFLVSLWSCGGKLPAGGSCSASTDCDTGLSCLALGQFSGAACTVVGKMCSISCTTDADCATLGATYKCFGQCDGGKMCGPTG